MPFIARAAAQIAGKIMSHLRLARRRQFLFHREDHKGEARGAKTALFGAFRGEEFRQPGGVLFHAPDRRHLMPIGPADEHRTGGHRDAIEENGAKPAIAGTAGLLHFRIASQAQRVGQVFSGCIPGRPLSVYLS